LPGHEHREARIAESVIAGVLIAGAVTAMRPAEPLRARLPFQHRRGAGVWSDCGGETRTDDLLVGGSKKQDSPYVLRATGSGSEAQSLKPKA
jgi:hypothetical protein